MTEINANSDEQHLGQQELHVVTLKPPPASLLMVLIGSVSRNVSIRALGKMFWKSTSCSQTWNPPAPSPHGLNSQFFFSLLIPGA